MATRFGVDVGGTFTDLVFYDEKTGTLRAAKVPTTVGAQENGIGSAIRAGIEPEQLADTEFFLHGTTVGLNALLERRGANVGLITTGGFRDVLELRRGDWGDPYDLFWKQPPPLVPRSMRLEVTERMGTAGNVITELAAAEVVQAACALIEQGAEAIAIIFLNAFVNPAHEQQALAAIRAAGIELHVSLSHQVSGEHREYERASTTVIDAYIRPLMGSYLDRLEKRLGEMGFSGHKLVTRCGGGAMTFAQAAERPFETILSGPVAGAEGAASLARALNLSSVITADVGGTSFDTTLITDGRPPVLHEGNILDMPVQTPWIDVRSIGAGGGSIARVDAGNLLRVGPESAGAYPGPAAYGRGGTEPTVTDAAFYLGMLGHGALASGLFLDRDLAEAALLKVAAPLNYTAEQVARGILQIATVQMAEAIREITIEQGVDPRQSALMPFGGAGPLFGTLLADELDIRTVVAPPFAGNFSAWGLLGADLTHSASRTRLMPLTEQTLREVDASFTTLLSELKTRPSVGQLLAAEASLELGLDMRYVGQEYSLTVPADVVDEHLASDLESIRKVFDSEYQRSFGHALDVDVEIVAVRATVRTSLPTIEPGSPSAPTGEPVADDSSVRAFSFGSQQWMDFAVVQRSRIGAAGLAGPAIILEDTTTTYMDDGYVARAGAFGALVIAKEDKKVKEDVA